MPPTGVVALVGPNNAGKTTFLRDLHSRCGGNPRETRVVGSTRQFSEKRGSSTAESWLRARFPTDNGRLYWPNAGASVAFTAKWPPEGTDTRSVLSHFAPFDARLFALRPQQLHAVDDGAKPESILGLLFERPTSMERISRAFADAFPGRRLVLSPGPSLKLRIQQAGSTIAGENEYEKLQRYGQLPTVNEQGSGTQSFVATLVLIETHPHPLLLIDEPEVSLAPPQARRLGQELVRTAVDRQVFLATHSSEILRGILETQPDQLTVLRLTRSNDGTHARKLDQAEVFDLWDSPLLRFTNTLDGLFHDRVVITEDDVDSRFYSWISAGSGGDVQYLSSGGKQNIYKLAKPLRAVGVDVRVIADFDLIRDENQLRKLVDTMGGNADEVLALRAQAYRALTGDETRSHAAARADLVRYLSGLANEQATSRSEVDRILDSSREFSTAKKFGCDSLAGDENRLAPVRELLAKLVSLRVHLVPSGEMESFARNCASNRTKGLDWLNRVLEEYDEDPLHDDLVSAREFVAGVLA